MGALTGSVMIGKETIGDCKVGIRHVTTDKGIAATVDEAGVYKLGEIPFGEYQVWVYPSPAYSLKVKNDKRIPKKYRNKDTSGITVSIDAVEEKEFDIVLK